MKKEDEITGQSKLTKRDADELGLNTSITRRDFIGSTAIGAGAVLLTMASPAAVKVAKAQTVAAPLDNLGPDWNGPAGIGDYARANGNTSEVVDIAHAAIRNQSFDKLLASAVDTGESVDLVVVGSGIAGLCAAHTYHKGRRAGSILLLDQHPIFGGESRQNEFEVDGYHLTAPQGATSIVGPLSVTKRFGFEQPMWTELGFPDEMPMQQPTGLSKPILVPEDVWAPMHYAWWRTDMGFYYPNKGWVKNPWRNGFQDAPLPEASKSALMRLEKFRTPPQRDDWAQWLDGMTYQQFIENEIGITGQALKDVMDYLRPLSAAYGMGLGGDVISAYQAYQFLQPGVNAYDRRLPDGKQMRDEAYFISYPGGHALIARMFVKKLIPDSFAGDYSIANLLRESIQWDSLDRKGQPVRLRLGSTVLAVAHDGPAESAKGVVVHFVKNGKVYKVHAKHAILAGQQHVNRHICRDIPPEYRRAMGEFHHAPMLTVNVAVRNWKFLENIGIATARWFEGFGWFLSLRRQVLVDGVQTQPLDPSKPTVLTLYIPFPLPGLPLREQCTAARMQLFGTRFADIETRIREQFTTMFGPYGFDARRDIAAIVANRFGHAYAAVPPYFYFGKDGAPAPKEIIRTRFNRIAFAHAELGGYQEWGTATAEGVRAGEQILSVS